MTMRERIEKGKLFTDMCEGLPEDRLRAKQLQQKFNASDPADMEGRMNLLKEIFGGKCGAYIEPPFYFCYGTNISIESAYINVNCNFIDDGKITIGKNVLFGPAVTIATVGHPIHPGMREYMYCDPVTICDNVWVGGGSTICPGVTIGENTVIGAGSVVTRDIPSGVIAAGNPCRVIREINENDMKYYYRDRPFDEADLAEEKALRGEPPK